MCTYAAGQPVRAKVIEMVESFCHQPSVIGYAPYFARLGLTVATLAANSHPEAAAKSLKLTSEMALASRDGYAARETISSKSKDLSLDARIFQALKK
jgi:hypothetical protein